MDRLRRFISLFQLSFFCPSFYYPHKAEWRWIVWPGKTELTDADLVEIEQRLNRGWVIRQDQMRLLIGMARERNWLKRDAEQKAKQNEKQED